MVTLRGEIEKIFKDEHLIIFLCKGIISKSLVTFQVNEKKENQSIGDKIND